MNRISRECRRLLFCFWVLIAAGCGGDSIGRLAEQLNDSDAHVRRMTATKLANLPGSSSELIAALTVASRGDDVEVREIAVEGLGKKAVESDTLFPALELALADQEQAVRLKAALAIYRFDPRNVSYRAILLDSLKAGQGTVFLEVGRMGADAIWAVPALTAALGDRRPSIRALAARALGEVGANSIEVTAALQRAQRDQAAAVRSAAQEALVQINVP
jgi:HEAT repeat protein